MPAGRPPIFETPEQMQEKADAFIDMSRGKNIPITIAGLCYELGFESRQSFYDYENNPEFSYTVKRIRLFVESQYEINLSGTTPTGSIFALKNMGWKDKQETEHSGSIDTRPIQYAPQSGNEPIKD